MKVAEKLVPELRFPDYEDDWEIKKLKNVFRNSRTKGGNASLTIFSVTQDHGLVPRNSLDRITADCANVSDNLQIQPKDLVYNMMRMWQGAIGLSYWNGMVSPAYIVLSPTKDACPENFKNSITEFKRTTKNSQLPISHRQKNTSRTNPTHPDP